VPAVDYSKLAYYYDALRLIRPDEFAHLADDAGLVVESVHADFTTAPYPRN
jgi:hypothetical protein